jgi:hypothetical protein
MEEVKEQVIRDLVVIETSAEYGRIRFVDRGELRISADRPVTVKIAELVNDKADGHEFSFVSAGGGNVVVEIADLQSNIRARSSVQSGDGANGGKGSHVKIVYGSQDRREITVTSGIDGWDGSASFQIHRKTPEEFAARARLLERVARSHKYKFDYGKPEEAAYVMELLGGEELLQKEFPLKYAAIQKHINHRTQIHVQHAAALTAGVSTADPGNDEDEVFVEIDRIVLLDKKPPVKGMAENAVATTMDFKYLSAMLSGVLCDTSKANPDRLRAKTRPWKYAMVSGTVYNADRPDLFPYITFHSRYTNDFRFEEAICSAASLPMSEIRQSRIGFSLTVDGLDQDGNSQTFVVNNSCAQYFTKKNEPVVSKITVSEPRSTVGNDPIIMGYGRSFYNADYQDGEYWNNHESGGVTKTIIPMSAEITFADGIVPQGLTDPARDPKAFTRPGAAFFDEEGNAHVISVYGRNLANDAAVYNLLKDRFTVADSGGRNTLKFDTYVMKDDAKSYDWYSDLSVGDHRSPPEYYKTKVFLQGGFSVDIKDTQSPTDFVDAIPISLESSGSGPYYESENMEAVPIPAILIWWGCFAFDTQITLEDGSRKAADRIQAGDKIHTWDGSATVQNVVMGTDKEIIKISVEGRAIRLSPTHPLLTSEGRISAGAVKPGDVLLTENGSATVISAEIEAYGKTVYNFALESGRNHGEFLIADGFWAGDFQAQNSNPSRPKKPRELTPEERTLLDEMDRLADRLAGR